MATWWFFKLTSYALLSDQAKAATKMNISPQSWLGQHMDASFQNCQDIKKLICTLEDEAKGRSKNTRPIRRYDEVWVYNIFCLAHSIPTIRDTIKLFHTQHIALHIYTSGYYDDCNLEDPVRHDYRMIFTLFDELSTRSLKRSEYAKRSASFDSPGPGRPSSNVCYATLSDTGKRIIERYCKDPNYRRDDAFEDIRHPKCFNNKSVEKISKNKFYQLVHECDNMLRALGYTTFRSKPPKAPEKKTTE